jgi:hypothetical protein
VFAIAHHRHHVDEAAVPASNVGTLHIDLLEGARAELKIDGKKLGTVQRGQEIPIGRGNHHVTLTAPGGDGVCTEDFEINGGDREVVDCMSIEPQQQRPEQPRLHIDKKVTWKLDRVSMRDFVLLAANTCGFSAVMPETLNATTTVNVKDAPCDTAFEVVLEAERLDYAYDPTANIVRIVAQHDLDDELATAESRMHDELPAGNTIDLDVKDAPLHDILKMLLDGGGTKCNLVIPEGVDAKVTIKLVNVPWNHGFAAVLAASGLWYRYRDHGKLIRIGSRHDIEDETARGMR